MTEPRSNYLQGIDKLFSDGMPKAYSKNQLIHYEGDPLTKIYLVQSGFIKAYTILDSGDTRTILILGPGDLFPLAFSATMDWENYQVRYFYQTLSDTRLLCLSSDLLKEHIESSSDNMNTYMGYITSSNEAIMNQLEIMKNKKAIDKVGLLLPYLVTKAGKQIKPGIYELQVKLSHQEIADLSGVTRETTTTLIKELEKMGALDQHKGKWLIDTNHLPAGHTYTL